MSFRERKQKLTFLSLRIRIDEALMLIQEKREKFKIFSIRIRINEAHILF